MSSHTLPSHISLNTKELGKNTVFAEIRLDQVNNYCLPGFFLNNKKRVFLGATNPSQIRCVSKADTKSQKVAEKEPEKGQAQKQLRNVEIRDHRGSWQQKRIRKQGQQSFKMAEKEEKAEKIRCI